MNIETGMKPGQGSEGRLAESGADSTTDTYKQKPTLAGQVITTIKILAGFALVGAALWAVEFWISAG
jgi:hypothetical protein